MVFIDDNYEPGNNSKIILSIHDTADKHNYYWADPYFLHFSGKNLNEWQSGFDTYEMLPFPDDSDKIIELRIYPGDKEHKFKNVRLRFLVPKDVQTH